ncbi:MAG: terpene cyclase/mutase family protein [Planctomycetes bacterium]|nr:terpene cyclase/mutase family protein [Planctomycetota bacterium]
MTDNVRATDSPSSGPFLDMMDALLIGGAERLGESFRRTHTDYLLAAQDSCGGFGGPDGTPDTYYTRFALHALKVLGLPVGEPAWASASAWLRALPPRPGNVVECLDRLQSFRMLEGRGCTSLEADARSRWREQTAALLAECRTDDGAVAFAPGGLGGPYYAFLAALCYDLLGRPMPDRERAVAAVLACATPDGGFGGQPGGSTGQTNPTAAAVCFLAISDALDEATARGGASFLAGLQRPDGGLAAHPAATVADLMSTFTALYAAAVVDCVDALRLGPVARFARALAQPGGGFRPVAIGGAADVEYTFYGIATLALLASIVAERG